MEKLNLLSPSDIKKAGSSWGTEFVAGTQTFVTLAYILAVQPLIMLGAELPQDIVFSATAVLSFLATLCMGVYARFPFAMSTGMGVNIIYAGLVASGRVTWQEGLGMVFWAGVVFLLTSIRIGKFSLREVIVNNLDVGLKRVMGAIVGLFLASLGFTNAGFVSIVDNALQVGRLTDPTIIVAFGGLVVTCFLFFGFTVAGKGKDGSKKMAKWSLPGAVLLGIFLMTIVLAIMGKVQIPGAVFSLPANPFALFPALVGSGEFWGSILKVQNWTYIMIFFLSALFSTIGTSIGCASKAGLMDPKTGEIPGINRLFMVDSTFSCLGAMFGLTDPTTFLESAAGIEAGGRTGWTSVFTSGWMLLALFLSPIFLMIPGVATGVALIVIGLSMMLSLDGKRNIDFSNPREIIPILFMIMVTAFTNDFAVALCVGLTMSLLLDVFAWATYPLVCRINEKRQSKKNNSEDEDEFETMVGYCAETHKKLLPSISSCVIVAIAIVNLILTLR